MLMKGYDQGIFDKVSYFKPQDGGGDKDEGEDETGGREKREADPTGIITITQNHIFWSLSLGILGLRLMACLEGKFGQSREDIMCSSDSFQQFTRLGEELFLRALGCPSLTQPGFWKGTELQTQSGVALLSQS